MDNKIRIEANVLGGTFHLDVTLTSYITNFATRTAPTDMRVFWINDDEEPIGKKQDIRMGWPLPPESEIKLMADPDAKLAEVLAPILPAEEETDADKLLNVMRQEKFVWRSVEGLVKATGLATERVIELLKDPKYTYKNNSFALRSRLK